MRSQGLNTHGGGDIGEGTVDTLRAAHWSQVAVKMVGAVPHLTKVCGGLSPKSPKVPKVRQQG